MSKLKDELIEFKQSEENIKKEERKTNRTSENCGIPLTAPTYA